jgi:hypothetical protein
MPLSSTLFFLISWPEGDCIKITEFEDYRCVLPVSPSIISPLLCQKYSGASYSRKPSSCFSYLNMRDKVSHLFRTTSSVWPASWSSDQIFRLLIMRPRLRFPVLPWGFFLEGEDSHGNHGLGSLVEVRFEVPSWYFIFVYHHPPHRDNVTAPHGRPNLRSRLHFSHKTGRGDHEVHKGHVVALVKKQAMFF